uniref:Uncharacterized protein n=1 Tax=Sphaerodactylus townsendi TaxID=933632 RepID=A0ACB8ESU9_9SAUR
MVKKGSSADKKAEESLDLDTSKDSPVNKGEQDPSLHKTSISSGGNAEFLGGMAVHLGKDDENAGSSLEWKLQTRVSFSGKQRDQSDSRAASNVSLQSLSGRKTRQQLQKEQAAAMTIQAAWRGCQVRREIDIMTKAATKIQATFRGHKTRKELPLHLCDHGRNKSKNKIQARKENRPVPEFQSNHLQQLGFIGAHTKSQSILPYNAKSRNSLKTIGDYTLLSPEITFLEIEMGHRTSQEVFACSSLNALATEIEWQRYHNAATIIQAAWRGYQVRKMLGIAAQTGTCHSESFRFNYVCEEIIRKDTVCQPPDHRARRHDAVMLGFVPRIRNINVYTVVKGAAASPKPNISLRVLSQNAVIQGFQRDMSAGVQGLYTIKSPGALRPAQLFVRVDMRKELKKLSSLITEKNPKPRKGQSKESLVTAQESQ